MNQGRIFSFVVIFGVLKFDLLSFSLSLDDGLFNFADVGVGLVSHSADFLEVVLQRLQTLLSLLKHLVQFSVHLINYFVIKRGTIRRLLVIRFRQIDEHELGSCGLGPFSELRNICTWLKVG